MRFLGELGWGFDPCHMYVVQLQKVLCYVSGQAEELLCRDRHATELDLYME